MSCEHCVPKRKLFQNEIFRLKIMDQWLWYFILCCINQWLCHFVIPMENRFMKKNVFCSNEIGKTRGERILKSILWTLSILPQPMSPLGLDLIVHVKDDIFWDHVIWALPLPPNFDNISTFPLLLSKIKLASRNVSNYTPLQTDFYSMVMKMLKYCQNLVEDEVLKQYDLKKCLLYQFLNKKFD